MIALVEKGSFLDLPLLLTMVFSDAIAGSFWLVKEGARRMLVVLTVGPSSFSSLSCSSLRFVPSFEGLTSLLFHLEGVIRLGVGPS